MRISTSTIYERGLAGISTQQQKLAKVQEQISSGRRILAPADDPVGAGQALQVAQSGAANQQYAINRGAAAGQLGLLDSALAQITDILHAVRVTAVGAGNPVLSGPDRGALALDVRARIGELIGIANVSDSEGQYLFSGYQGDTVPFARAGGTVQYQGDDGQRLAQVAATRAIAVNESGSRVLERIRTGNGVFDVSAHPANSGSGIAGIGGVLDPAAMTGHDYEIGFSVAGPTTTYTVTDLTTGLVVAAAQPYVSGAGISFDGVQVKVDGAVADGDRVMVAPSGYQDLFRTLEDLAGALEAPAGDAAGRARLGNALGAALRNVDQALDHMLNLRASVGTRMREIDALDASGEDLAMQYERRLSQLRDVDYAAAVSELTRRQVYLEAAQKSFVQVTRLSLFDLI